MALVRVPGLAGLEALALDGSRLGTGALETLVNSPHLKNLRRFSLSAGHSRVPEALGPEGVRVEVDLRLQCTWEVEAQRRRDLRRKPDC